MSNLRKAFYNVPSSSHSTDDGEGIFSAWSTFLTVFIYNLLKLFKKEIIDVFWKRMNWNNEGRKNTIHGDNNSVTGDLFWHQFSFDNWGSISNLLDSKMLYFFWKEEMIIYIKKKISLRNMLDMHQLTGYKMFTQLRTFRSSNRLTGSPLPSLFITIHYSYMIYFRCRYFLLTYYIVSSLRLGSGQLHFQFKCKHLWNLNFNVTNHHSNGP